MHIRTRARWEFKWTTGGYRDLCRGGCARKLECDSISVFWNFAWDRLASWKHAATATTKKDMCKCNILKIRQNREKCCTYNNPKMHIALTMLWFRGLALFYLYTSVIILTGKCFIASVVTMNYVCKWSPWVLLFKPTQSETVCYVSCKIPCVYVHRMTYLCTHPRTHTHTYIYIVENVSLL